MTAQQDLRAAPVCRLPHLEPRCRLPRLYGRFQHAGRILDADIDLAERGTRGGSPRATPWAIEPGISAAAAKQQPPDTAIDRCPACGVK